MGAVRKFWELKNIGKTSFKSHLSTTFCFKFLGLLIDEIYSKEYEHIKTAKFYALTR
jgi:hypothetical protein